MITKYITYCKEGPANDNGVTEFEFTYPKLTEEHESVSHELVDVQISGTKIYYTFRIEIRLKGMNWTAGIDEEQEVSPFER